MRDDRSVPEITTPSTLVEHHGPRDLPSAGLVAWVDVADE